MYDVILLIIEVCFMRRYSIILFYSNGSTSHQLNTSSYKRARAHTESILKDEDLRETASRLCVMQGENVIYDAAPDAMPMDSVKEGISWPKTGAPIKYKDSQRITISVPQALLDQAKIAGKGNVSRGILQLALEARPELAAAVYR